jgi:hypothetical protein
MLMGLRPYIMEMQFKDQIVELQNKLEDRERQIESLKKVVEYDVKEIRILKDRLIALGGDPDCGLGARLLAQTPMPTRNKRTRVSKL